MMSCLVPGDDIVPEQTPLKRESIEHHLHADDRATSADRERGDDEESSADEEEMATQERTTLLEQTADRGGDSSDVLTEERAER